jgi:hypothetical protein
MTKDAWEYRADGTTIRTLIAEQQGPTMADDFFKP